MKVENINVNTEIEKVRDLLKKDKSTSPALIGSVELLITVVTILLTRMLHKKLNFYATLV